MEKLPQIEQGHSDVELPPQLDQQQVLQQINSLRLNLGGPELIRLLIFLGVFYVFINSCKKDVAQITDAGSVPEQGVSAERLPDNENIEAEVLKPGDVRLGGYITDPNKGTIFVSATFFGVKEGTTKDIRILIELPNGQTRITIVRLTSKGNNLAEGYMNEDCRKIAGSKTYLLDENGQKRTGKGWGPYEI